MKKLKYKKTDVKDEVVIRVTGSAILLMEKFGFNVDKMVERWVDDFMDEDTGEIISLQRHNVLWNEPDSNIPEFMRIKFYIYKKKPSWIECDDKIIRFEYDIVKQLKDSENDHYLLKFLLENKYFHIPVPFDCTSKKELIKILLDQLIS
jgi:hypothetical protein